MHYAPYYKRAATNAVYGFITMLFKILEEYNPDYISVAFDRKEATFRHNEYPITRPRGRVCRRTWRRRCRF